MKTRYLNRAIRSSGFARRLRLETLEDRTAPAAGMLDPTFGTGGLVTTRFTFPSPDGGTAAAVDSLGRAVVAGYTFNGLSDVIAITRYTAAGELDTSFGGTGIVTTFGSDYPSYVAIDSLDRVVVAGATGYGSNSDVAVARLTAAGALDSSFGGTGIVTLYSGSGGLGTTNSYATSVAIDSLDRVVVAGYVSIYDPIFGGYSYFALDRLTAAGAHDASFDGDGNQTIDFFASGMAVDSLDRVVVGGGSNADFAVARLTVAGALDASFDGDGKQTIDFGGYEGAEGVAVDSLDRVVVGGSTYDGSNSDFAVARFTAAGALDASFDGDGKQTIDFGASYDWAYGVSVDSLDRVVVAGGADTGATQYDFAVARLTAAGALDASFDGDGKQTTGLVGTLYATGTTVAVDSRGRTVVAGYTNNTYSDFVITRYTAAGAFDTSFGGTGTVIIDVYGVDRAYAVAVDSLDRVVVAGDTYDGSNREFAVVRLTAAGALDTSFDGDGKQTIDFGASDYWEYGVAVDSLDRVVVAGGTGVARLTAAGALDLSFDGDGKQAIDFWASAVAVDSLDRIVVAGYASNGSNYDFAVVRLTAAGALDASFDADGKQTINFGAATDFASAVAVDSLDRVVVAGLTSNYQYCYFAVSRLTAAGALDASFDGDGKQTIDFAGKDFANAVAVDSLDRVVVAGATDNGSNYDFAVARLTASGALDTDFDGDGKQSIDFGGYERAEGVAVDSAGRVVVAGTSVNNGSPFAVARLTGDTTVAAVQVNDGSAQRSMVTSIKVTFSEPVSFPAGINNAFQLQRTGPGAPTGLVNLNAVAAGNTVTITFDDPTYAPGTAKSLIDGTYKLTLVSDKIQSASGFLDGDLNGTPGGDLILNFHRLFGDADGNGSVNSTDLAAFRTYFGVGPSIFDFDGNGQTNSTDFVEFRKRFGLSLGP